MVNRSLIGCGAEQAAPDTAVLPGIFFVYDLAPFMVEISMESYPLTHLFTRLCAIVGGIFTVR